MKYEHYYELRWTWHRPNSIYCYSDFKCFDTEQERNKFALDLFAENKDGKIILDSLEETDIKSWTKIKKTLDKPNGM